MNRSALVKWALLLLLTMGAVSGCSEQEADEPSRSPNAGATQEPTTEIPVEEPTVQDLRPKSPEELSRAQRQLDAQCAQMDIQEAQNMGIKPEKFGCEADGTGIPIKEWIERNE